MTARNDKSILGHGGGGANIIDRDGTVLRILPPFTDLEVSLEASMMHPVSHYRVDRGRPGGMFTCISTTPLGDETRGLDPPPDPRPGCVPLTSAAARNGPEPPIAKAVRSA